MQMRDVGPTIAGLMGLETEGTGEHEEGKVYTGSRMTQMMSAWMTGIGYQTYSWNGFALQPELIYRVNGAKFEDAASLRMNYLELPVNVQWGIDLLVAKPYVFVAPFIGCNLANAITPEGYVSKETLSNAVRLLDYGVGAGLGIDFWYLQLTAKYNWMFGPVADWSAFMDRLAGIRFNMATFEVALAIKF